LKNKGTDCAVPGPSVNMIKRLKEVSSLKSINQLFLYIDHLGEGKKIPRSLEAFVKELVACSMPLSFHIEALKCQSIVMRTNVIRCLKNKENKPKGAQGNSIWLDSFPQWRPLEAYQELWGEHYEEKLQLLTTAVESTQGEILTFNDRPIDARYHMVCGGATENSENVMGNVIRYLRRVLCEYCQNSPYYENYRDISIGEVASDLGIKFSRSDAKKNLTMEKIFDDIHRDEAGRVTRLRVAGREFAGIDFMNRLGLESTRFSWRPQVIRFLTQGKGDGLGLCQYGAEGMAKEGNNAEAILKYYFTDVQIKKIPEPCINKPLMGKVLVIDPAHGGNGGEGHVGPGGTQEAAVNLSIALALESCLNALGATVYLTRRGDEDVPLIHRAALANEINPHFFISIHQNYLKNSTLSGCEVYYYRGDTAAKSLGELIGTALGKLELLNRGAKTAEFFLLRDVKVSSIHIEVGYLSNVREAARLSQESFREAIGKAIGGAVADYFEINFV